MAATVPSPFSHWQVPSDDILRFKVQATNVEPRVSAQLASWLKDTSGQWPCRPRLRLTRRDVRIRLEGLHPALSVRVTSTDLRVSSLLITVARVRLAVMPLDDATSIFLNSSSTPDFVS